MHPDLFSFGRFTLHAYGTALALSFLLGLLLARYRARRRGVNEHAVVDLFQLIVLSSIIGARFFFVIFHLDSYRGQWLHIFYLWEGGLTLYGGLLLAFLRTGRPILSKDTIFTILPGLLLLMTAAFVAGFALA